MLEVKLSSGYHRGSQWKWATTGHGAHEWWKRKILPTFPEAPCPWHCHAWSKERGDRSWGCKISFPGDVWKNICAGFSQTSGDVVAHMLRGILASFLPVTLWIHSVSYHLALNVQFQTNSFQMDTFTKLKMKPNPVIKPRFLSQCTTFHQCGLAYSFLHQKLYKQKDEFEQLPSWYDFPSF